MSVDLLSHLPSRARIPNGFTLIELLIVIVIVSIAASFAVLSYGDFGSSRKIITAAEELASYMKLLRQRAILEGNVFGIGFTKGGCQTYKLDSLQNWQSLPAKGAFHDRKWPDQTIIEVNLPRKDKIIRIYASGEMTAGSLIFGTVTDNCLAVVRIEANGQISTGLQNDCPK